MTIERSNRPIAAARMAAAARQLLAASTLCAIATVTPSGRAYLDTAYFAWTRDYDIVWLSAPRAQHRRRSKRTTQSRLPSMSRARRGANPTEESSCLAQHTEARGEEAEHGETIYAQRFPETDEADLTASLAVSTAPSEALR